MTAYKNCKAGDVQPVSMGDSNGYGFNTLSGNNRPLVTLAFATWGAPSKRGPRSSERSKRRLRSRRTVKTARAPDSLARPQRGESAQGEARTRREL